MTSSLCHLTRGALQRKRRINHARTDELLRSPLPRCSRVVVLIHLLFLLLLLFLFLREEDEEYHGEEQFFYRQKKQQRF